MMRLFPQKGDSKMIRYMTAGESHGKGLVAIIDGVPSQLELSADDIDIFLAGRQKGYGRGGRQKIESDKVEIISGVRHGRTIGSPIALLIKNRDFVSWRDMMSCEPVKMPVKEFVVPRPGHADLSGGMKYGHYDLRNVLERASARETAARVAAGAVCIKALAALGVRVLGYVTSIGGIKAEDPVLPIMKIEERMRAVQKKVPGDLRVADAKAAVKMIKKIDIAAAAGDTLGGTVKVLAEGLPAGLGDYTQWDKKLDARIAAALMSIQAFKAVGFGAGFSYAGSYGSKIHDAIYYSRLRGYYRKTNNAGGIEGGMTNGMPIDVSAAVKPISTVKKGVQSVDCRARKPSRTVYERSDVCAVPAASVIAASVVSIEFLSAVLETAGGSSMGLVSKNFENYKKYVKKY